MKNDSKSALKIMQIISTLSVLIILATSTQLFVFTNNNNSLEEIATIAIEENTQMQLAEEIQETVVTTNILERDILVTNRGQVDREIEETKYISVEEIVISRDMDLTVRCGISKEDFVELMRNLSVDRKGFFYENSETIYDLCEKYEINEIFFCGLIAGEAGWGISSGHRNACNYISMMSGGKLIKYSTPEEGLEAAAKLLHDRYLSEDGSYYSGKTLSGVQRRFCPNSTTWVGLIYGCMKQIIK